MVSFQIYIPIFSTLYYADIFNTFEVFYKSFICSLLILPKCFGDKELKFNEYEYDFSARHK